MSVSPRRPSGRWSIIIAALMKLVECVPNVSDGRRLEVISAIRAAVEEVAGVYILDLHADSAHNRSVLTFVGGPAEVAEAAFRCVARAAELINMEHHRGEHPRMGATDVLPFVPLGQTTMAECIDLARRLGRRIGQELDVPVYLYYEAATRPERRWLPNVRRGEYEAIKQEIGCDPQRAPDFGPPRLGSAGATAVGARPFLIAFNVNLASSDQDLARSIARTVRQSSGGLPAVQARGLATDDPSVVQVSMNLLDYHLTPLHVLFERVRDLAAAQAVEVQASEVVGLLPAEALSMTASHFYQLRHFGSDAVLENRLLGAVLANTKS
jgi:glutamate formiminotransferase